MKNNHTSWSCCRGNHLSKILVKKCSKKLQEVTKKLRQPVFEEEKVEELYGEILMSMKATKKEGKGYEYPVIDAWWGWKGRYRERKRNCLPWRDIKKCSWDYKKGITISEKSVRKKLPTFT